MVLMGFKANMAGRGGRIQSLGFIDRLATASGVCIDM
jgi:ribosomal protein L34